MSNKIDFATLKVPVTFKVGDVVTGTGQATLINLGGGLGRLLYIGDTGYNDAGTGVRELIVQYPGVFSNLLGGTVNSFYSNNAQAYQAHARITTSMMDNYVHKETNTPQMRYIQFDITGVLV